MDTKDTKDTRPLNSLDPGGGRFADRTSAPVSQRTEDLASAAINCALTVHKVLGPGFLERAYDRALQLELEAQGIPFESQRPIFVTYRNTQLMAQRADLVVGGLLLGELKAVARIEPLFVSQVVSYLKATDLRLGLIIDFNSVFFGGRHPPQRAVSGAETRRAACGWSWMVSLAPPAARRNVVGGATS